jgi:hypothetical protein
MDIPRRRFLGLAAGSMPLVLLTVGAAQAQAPACYDPAALPLSQKNRRRSLGYTEASGDPARHCSVCSFFTAGDAGCGTCGLLSGPVNAGAVCSSFAPRAK